MSRPCPSCRHLNQTHAHYCSHCGAPMDEPPQKPEVKKRVALLAMMTLLPLGIVIGVFALQGSGKVFGPGKAKGEIRSTGSPHGEYVMQPTSCFSGERENWFGVWITPPLQKLRGRTGFKGGLKLVKDHSGQWLAFAESPKECKGLNCTIRRLDARHCKMDIDVHNTNTRVNRIRVREGYAKISCTFAKGSYSASLTFSGCK